MKSKGKLIDLALSMNGKQRLMIELDADFRQSYDELKDVPVDITIQKHREKRSLDANAYAWVLIDKIAEKMRITKTEVYRRAIREIGGVTDTICIEDRAAKRFKDNWELNGIGWQVEKMASKIPDCVVLICYYGSSSYDTYQMSALIDSLVQEAKSLGIETRSPEEISSLLKEYEKRC